jgi:hypothetical protein
MGDKILNLPGSTNTTVHRTVLKKQKSNNTGSVSQRIGEYADYGNLPENGSNNTSYRSQTKYSRINNNDQGLGKLA